MDDLRQKLKVAVSENNIDHLDELLCICEREAESLIRYQQLLDSALADAIIAGNIHSARFMISKGSNVNRENVFQQSLLEIALNNKSDITKYIIDLLIKEGANINHTNRCGVSDVMLIISEGVIATEYELQLMDSVSNSQERSLITGGSYLHIVGRRQNENKIPLLKKIIEMGVSVNSKDNHDDTPFHIVAKEACLDSMEFLIDNGADITATNRNGETVLHSLSDAIGRDSFPDCLRFPIQKGLDINAIDNQGRTILHHALLMEETDCRIIQEMFVCGLKTNVCDSTGGNELFYALTDIDFRKLNPDVRTEVLQLLIKSSVNINQKDIFGTTPLHLATNLNSLDLLVTLLDLGADFCQRTTMEAMALHWACKHYNMAHVLIWTHLRNDADINARDAFGSTPLHFAVWYRNLSVAQTLLQAGADASIRDDVGDTPSDLAKRLDLHGFDGLLQTYESLEPLELTEYEFKHSDGDSVSACPILRYIVKNETGLRLKEHMDHLMLHETSVRKFITKIVTLKHMGLYYGITDNDTICRTFDSLMETVASKVAEINPIFQSRLRIEGSVFEGTKVNIPNEFDYLWILEEFNNAFEPVESSTFPTGFLKLRLKDKTKKIMFVEFMDQTQFLDCNLVIRTFYKLVNSVVMETLNNDTRFANILCLNPLREIWCSISSLEFKYIGIQAKDVRLSIDIVPTIVLPDWMPDGFPVSKIAATSDSESTMFAVVFKTPNRLHVRDFTLFFRVSYAYIEQRMFRCLPEYAKKGYIILKALSDAGYIPHVLYSQGKVVDQIITSYYWKTCALYVFNQSNDEASVECGETSPKTALSFAKEIVNYFEKCLKVLCLSPFFDSKKNLIGVEGLDGVFEKDVFDDLIPLIKSLLNMSDLQ